MSISTSSLPATDSASSTQVRRPSFEELLGVLAYNQGLVEFADSKAGSLILLNSLLIAAVSALPNNGNMGIFKLVSVVAASVAVYLCFQVISSKAGTPEDGPTASIVKKKPAAGWKKDDFLFFGCIAEHKTGEDYCRAYGNSDPDARRRALLQRTYIIAGIAKRKFSQYALAQKVTSGALVAWVVVNVLPFLYHHQ